MALRIASGTEWADRFKQGVAAKSGNYATGVQRGGDWAGAATSPDAVAARSAGWNAANNSGFIDRRIQELGSAQYKAITVAKAPNWLAGVTAQANQQNITNGGNTLFGMLQGQQQAIAGLPRGTFEQNMARAQAAALYLHQQRLAR